MILFTKSLALTFELGSVRYYHYDIIIMILLLWYYHNDIIHQVLSFDFWIGFGQIFPNNLGQMLHTLVLWMLKTKGLKIKSNLVVGITFRPSGWQWIQFYIHIFIVNNLEFESENSHSILMGKSLLDGVVVDVSVNQVQLKRVPACKQHKLKCLDSWLQKIYISCRSYNLLKNLDLAPTWLHQRCAQIHGCPHCQHHPWGWISKCFYS